MHFFKTLVFGAVLITCCAASAQNINPQKVADNQSVEKKVNIALKTDEQIKYEDETLPDNWDKMSHKEQEKYALKVLEDRFILTTMNFKIITSGRTKLCTFNVTLNNNSARKINRIYVNYRWGDTSTFVSFSGVTPGGESIGVISLVGDVCSRVTQGADYEIKTCDVEGLSEEQCRMRVYPVK